MNKILSKNKHILQQDVVNLSHDLVLNLSHDLLLNLSHDLMLNLSHDLMLNLSHDLMLNLSHDLLLNLLHDLLLNLSHDFVNSMIAVINLPKTKSDSTENYLHSLRKDLALKDKLIFVYNTIVHLYNNISNYTDTAWKLLFSFRVS